jgi:sulfide:quinone oxidoreductase
MNVTWLNAKLAIAPQIAFSEIDDLKKMGFQAIINNRPDGEAPEQPLSDALARETVRRGLHYAYLPIVPGEMTDSDAAEFARMVSEAEGPVLAFCRTGNRSTQLWNRAREITPDISKS